MNTLNEVSSTLNASEILSRQRKAFLKAEPPTLQQRKASLAKLRAAVIESVSYTHLTLPTSDLV